MWTTFLSVPLSAACAALGGGKTACDGLVYKEFGLTRAEYLPCAGEMIAALDRLGPQADAMLAGDKNARGEALDTLHELERLMKKAGGRRNMDSDWNDRGLTSLNRQILNAYGPYSGCLMFGPKVAAIHAKGTREERQSALEQCTGPARLAREASNAYRYMR
jgi:hypothetical protein